MKVKVKYTERYCRWILDHSDCFFTKDTPHADLDAIVPACLEALMQGGEPVTGLVDLSQYGTEANVYKAQFSTPYGLWSEWVQLDVTVEPA